MKKVVAVDDKLVNVRQALEDQGFQVTDLVKGAEQAGVVVVSGMEENVTGDQTTRTQAQVIDAAGLNAKQVISQVEKAFEQQT